MKKITSIISVITFFIKGILNIKKEREYLLETIDNLQNENEKLKNLILELEVKLSDQVKLTEKVRDSINNLPNYNSNVKGEVNEKDNNDAINRINDVFS